MNQCPKVILIKFAIEFLIWLSIHICHLEIHRQEARRNLTTTNKVVLAGEVRGPSVSKEQIISQVRDCIKDIGYEQDGFHWQNCDVDSFLHEQSTDITMGVDSGNVTKNEGAKSKRNNVWFCM